MPDITLSARTLLLSPWFLTLLGVVGTMFIGAFLWKILRSEEGFLFGYGNWVVGKWQAKRNAVEQAGAQPVIRQQQGPTAEAQAKKTVANLEKALRVERSVLILSRLLDGDLAYMIVNCEEWEAKLLRTLQTLVSGVTRVVHPAGRCRCGFFILDDEEQHLVLVAGEGYTGARRPKLTLEQSCAGRAFLTGEDYYCRDISTDPAYYHSARGNRDFRSIACVPVRAGTAVFGVICLDAEEADAFRPEDFVYLETFAAKLAVLCAFHTLQVAGVCDVPPEEGE